MSRNFHERLQLFALVALANIFVARRKILKPQTLFTSCVKSEDFFRGQEPSRQFQQTLKQNIEPEISQKYGLLSSSGLNQSIPK